MSSKGNYITDVIIARLRFPKPLGEPIIISTDLGINYWGFGALAEAFDDDNPNLPTPKHVDIVRVGWAMVGDSA